jgi:hypothetical protein
MSELLIRVVSKVNVDDADLNSMLLKRGDVVTIQPDGHNWGTQELSNPDWRIVRILGMTRAEADALMEEDFSFNENGDMVLSGTAVKSAGIRRKRRIALNSIKWDASHLAALLDNTRATPIIEVVGKNLSERQSFTETKT